MATRLSEQLDRIFANLKLAQSGRVSTDLPSYGWQGDHLSIAATDSEVALEEKSLGTLEPPGKA